MNKKIIIVFSLVCIVMTSFGQVSTTTAIPLSYINCSACLGTNWFFSATNMSVITYTAGELTNTAFLSNFNFNIPAGSLVQGIELTVGTYTGSSTHFKDSTVNLLLNNSIIGTNKTQNFIFPQFWTRTYGGSSDLWGNSLTAADINNPGFGIAFAAKQTFSTSAPYDVFVLNGLMANTLPVLKIYYQLPTGLNEGNKNTDQVSCYYSGSDIIAALKNTDKQQEYTIKVYDLLGKLHKAEAITFNDKNVFHMNVEDESRGVYIVKISNSQNATVLIKKLNVY